MELANLVNTGKGKGKMIVGNNNDNYKGNKPSGSRTTPNAAIGPTNSSKVLMCLSKLVEPLPHLVYKFQNLILKSVITVSPLNI